MPRYVALLRSVNVAGHGRITMDALRASFEGAGCRDIRTYIQTGNVMFTVPTRRPAAVIASIEDQLTRDFGTSPAVILRTTAQLVGIAASSPYAARGEDPARHHVTFLAGPPARQVLASLELPPSGRDELVVEGTEVFVSTPDGYAGTKFTGAFLERRLKVLSTTRNWNTVVALGGVGPET